MSKKLWAIANATNELVTYSSTENSGDTVILNPSFVTHTGGKDDNFVKIADCSASGYYNEHHCSIIGQGLNLTFWNNDDDNLLYFSTNGTFDGGVAYSGTDNYVSSAIMIYFNEGNLEWSVQDWDVYLQSRRDEARKAKS